MFAGREEPCAGAVTGLGLGGQRLCRVPGQCCRQERPLRAEGRKERTRRGHRAGAGGWMSGFFWQRAAGKLAGPEPGSSELRLVPPFHEH